LGSDPNDPDSIPEEVAIDADSNESDLKPFIFTIDTSLQITDNDSD